jgi:hypothetical protein
MKANLLKFNIVLITATLLLAPAFAGADVFMKEKQHTDGMTIMGQAQPAQDRTYVFSEARHALDGMRLERH